MLNFYFLNFTTKFLHTPLYHTPHFINIFRTNFIKANTFHGAENYIGDSTSPFPGTKSIRFYSTLKDLNEYGESSPQNLHINLETSSVYDDTLYGPKRYIDDVTALLRERGRFYLPEGSFITTFSKAYKPSHSKEDFYLTAQTALVKTAFTFELTKLNHMFKLLNEPAGEFDLEGSLPDRNYLRIVTP